MQTKELCHSKLVGERSRTIDSESVNKKNSAVSTNNVIHVLNTGINNKKMSAVTLENPAAASNSSVEPAVTERSRSIETTTSSSTNQSAKTPLLKVENLCQYFKVSSNYTVKAVDDVSFEIYPGETYGLVGESGSGKSTIGRDVIRLYNPTRGKINFEGHDISGKLKKSTNRFLHTNMQMIFQDPMACLNPRKKVGEIIGEGLDIHHLYNSRQEREEKIQRILKKVGLAPEHIERYPHQFSGGQRQRVGIARALIMNPKLVIADECISALDVSIQAQVVNMMKDIQEETGCAYLFIAHDLSMVKYISDRIGVLHLGHLLETGTTDEIFSHPIHPYTKSLLSAIPRPNPIVEKNRQIETYNYFTSGIDYSKGKMQLVSGNHFVKATDEEFSKWTS